MNWGYCAHLHLQPVLSDQTTYITLILLMFPTSTSELIPPLWLSWILLGVFGLFIYFISNPSPIIYKRCRCYRPNWKRSKRCIHRKLNYWLDLHCRHQTRHRPPCLDDSFFSSHHYNNHRRWRTGRAHARSFFKRRRMDEFLSGRKDGYCPWEYEGLSKTARDSFCDEDD